MFNGGYVKMNVGKALPVCCYEDGCGTIHWGDEMGLRSDRTTGCSFGKRGVTPVIPGTGKHFGCNMISAITNRGKLRFMVFKKRFADPVFIDFATRLIKDVRRKVFLIKVFPGKQHITAYCLGYRW